MRQIEDRRQALVQPRAPVDLRVNGRAEITAYGLGTVTIAGTPACMLSGPGVANVRCGGSDQGQVR